MLTLPCKSAVIDGEVVACKEDGTPDFRALHSGDYTQEILCVWTFDLMELNGEDLRPFPLVVRKRKLEVILRRHDHPYLRHSEPFKNGEQLLAECRQRRLEGIVSKRKHSPYKSGKCDWMKVKCAQRKQDNKDRGDLFAKQMARLDRSAAPENWWSPDAPEGARTRPRRPKLTDAAASFAVCSVWQE